MRKEKEPCGVKSRMALHSPLRETLKTLTTLETFFSQRPFGLKAQKPPAQGKTNNVSRHPGWTTSRMARPTGAKAKKHAPALSRLLLFQSALPPTSQPRAPFLRNVPWAMRSLPRWGAPLKTSTLTTSQPHHAIPSPQNFLAQSAEI